MLYGDTTPFWTRTLTDIEWKGKQVERHDGFATVAIQHYGDALRRSGANNVVIRDLGTENFQVLRLSPSVTNEEARAKAKSLGQLAFGLITTRNAWAIRVRPEHFVEADKQLNPEYTDLIGDELLTMPRGDAYELRLLECPRICPMRRSSRNSPWKPFLGTGGASQSISTASSLHLDAKL